MRVILKLFDWIHDRHCPCKYTDWVEKAAEMAERQANGKVQCSCGNPDCERLYSPREGRAAPTCADCGGQHWVARCRGCGDRMCETSPHMRVYCPKCGEVGCGMKRQGQWIARPHYRAWMDGNARTGKPCTGGPIDQRKDKAP